MMDVRGCADITDSDHIIRDKFIAGMKADPVQRALQVKAQPGNSFYHVLAPSPLSAMQTALPKLAQDVATLKWKVASSKKDSPQTHMGEYPLRRNQEGDWKC